MFAGEVLSSGEWHQVADEFARSGADHFHDTGRPWPCGPSGERETPDLMLGLAGVGYLYLRLHDRGRIPSVLIPVPA
jgi:hypothetical protein